MLVILCALLALAVSSFRATHKELLPGHEQFLQDNRWTVVRVPRGDHVENGSCNYLDKTIRLYTDAPSTYFHEVGHAVSRGNWYGDYFQRLYEEENVSSESAEEYFAWAFSKYYTNNPYLRLVCPETHYMLKHGFFSNNGQIDHEFLSSGGAL